MSEYPIVTITSLTTGQWVSLLLNNTIQYSVGYTYSDQGKETVACVCIFRLKRTLASYLQLQYKMLTGQAGETFTKTCTIGKATLGNLFP